MTHRQGRLNTMLRQKCSLLLQDNYFNFRFLDTSNTDKGAGDSWEYTGCPGRNVKNFGSVFLILKYTDITQNTYIQSWTVTEIVAIEKWELLWCPRTVSCQLTVQMHARPSVRYHITYYTAYHQADKAIHFAAECAVSHLTSEPGMLCHV
jgi:hypothetical protein